MYNYKIFIIISGKNKIIFGKKLIKIEKKVIRVEQAAIYIAILDNFLFDLSKRTEEYIPASKKLLILIIELDCLSIPVFGYSPLFCNIFNIKKSSSLERLSISLFDNSSNNFFSL